MAEYIVMPKLGFDMREGEFVTWHKEIGEMVNKGDVVAEIESDKATLELEAQVSGILLATMAEGGDLVEVGSNVAIVGEEGEDVSSLIDQGGPDEAPEEPAAAVAASPPATNGSTPPVPSGQAAGSASSEFPDGVKATPVARRVAAEHDVNLLQVPFEGERIRKADVEAFVASGGATAVSAPAAAPAAAPQTVQVTVSAAEAGAEDEVIPATRLRQAIARRMTESKTTVPHFQVTMEIDVGAALALRKQLNGMLAEEGVKISINDILVKAAGLALRDFPMLNASFAGENIIVRKRINVGSAVATEKGLLTVVQKDTDKSTLGDIARDNKAMIERARDGKNLPDDFADGTFTISNLGVYGVAEFVAIINPPEAAILAIGGIHERAIFVDGEVQAAQLMKVTMSADHRVTDGAEVAQFLVKFKALLEEPMKLLV
ncbi:MAG: dihydrolipoamide acetyltransferase family protein [Ardenticatenaceae bacterium]|nr:dihydrolipoamide acetyltransferase family protein [Ardenticatenaceae bacterium]